MTATDRLVLRMLADFAKLARKATDEVGWIALKFSCSREKAQKMIEHARATEL